MDEDLTRRRLENVAVIERSYRHKYGRDVSAQDVVETLRAERRVRDAAVGVPDEKHKGL